MDKDLIRKLRDLGALSRTSKGEEGVRVSLQYKPRLEEPSRSARREILQRAFRKVASEVLARGLECDLKSLSVSGQTVQAVLPVRDYESLVDELEQKDIRVDALLDQQIVPPE